MSECPACRRKPPQASGISAYLASAIGPRWWAAEVGEICAQVIVAVQREGICDMHAAWLATLARLRILIEARRRAMVPGLVLVMYGEISDGAYEPMSRDDVRRSGEAVICSAQRFVSGSPLAAIVEIDTDQRRARVTVQVAGSDPLQAMQIDSRRLAAVTASDVFDGLRQRAALG